MRTILRVSLPFIVAALFSPRLQAQTLIQPHITWAPIASITVGTFLGPSQLNATADVPGVSKYEPGTGATLGLGFSVLWAHFIPANPTLNAETVEANAILVTAASIRPAARIRLVWVHEWLNGWRVRLRH